MRLTPTITTQIPIPAFAPEERLELEAGDAVGNAGCDVAGDAVCNADEAALEPDVIVDKPAFDTTVVTMVSPVSARTTVDEVIAANSSITPRERRGSVL
jgi:hypothetical protein